MAQSGVYTALHQEGMNDSAQLLHLSPLLCVRHGTCLCSNPNRPLAYGPCGMTFYTNYLCDLGKVSSPLWLLDALSIK